MPPPTGQSANDSKSIIRRALRRKRRSLSSHMRTSFDESIQQHISQLIKSQKANSIACYWPCNGEPDITPVCRQLMADGHELALPVISTSDNFSMQFHWWRADTLLTKNKYGILEPEASPSTSISDFDLLIMPLLGYDQLGNRLGMGAGYYDRHLESLRDLEKPLRVGIAYSLQKIDLIDTNKWDIPLHGLVNEHGWFTFVE